MHIKKKQEIHTWSSGLDFFADTICNYRSWLWYHILTLKCCSVVYWLTHAFTITINKYVWTWSTARIDSWIRMTTENVKFLYICVCIQTYEWMHDWLVENVKYLRIFILFNSFENRLHLNNYENVIYLLNDSVSHLQTEFRVYIRAAKMLFWSPSGLGVVIYVTGVYSSSLHQFV